MNRAFLILTIVASLTARSTVTRTLAGERGRPFYSERVEIAWAVPTDQLPESLRVFKTVSAAYSPNVVSNLVRLGGFTAQDRAAADLDGKELPKEFLTYRSRDHRSGLTISSMRGYGELYNPQRSDFTKPLEDVPDQMRAYELGLELLRDLEIPTNSLITREDGQLKAWFYPGTRSYRDKVTGEFVTEPCTMGIEFRRKVDGIYCFRQFIHMQFENREKLTQLSLHWAGLQALKTSTVASVQQLVSWIKEGRARVQSLSGPSDARWVKVSDVRKLIIQDATVSYYPEGDAFRYLYPIATLKCEVELGADDKETIWLFCPIIKDGLPPVKKSSDGFNVYPSALREKQRREEGGA